MQPEENTQDPILHRKEHFIIMLCGNTDSKTVKSLVEKDLLILSLKGNYNSTLKSLL